MDLHIELSEEKNKKKENEVCVFFYSVPRVVTFQTHKRLLILYLRPLMLINIKFKQENIFFRRCTDDKVFFLLIKAHQKSHTRHNTEFRQRLHNNRQWRGYVLMCLFFFWYFELLRNGCFRVFFLALRILSTRRLSPDLFISLEFFSVFSSLITK